LVPSSVLKVLTKADNSAWTYGRSISHGSAQTFVSSLIVEELMRLGLKDFVLSPGARAIPFVLSLNTLKAESQNKPRCQIINDERSAAFFAQGISKSGNIAALICTSGTAVANYLPGVVEAYYSKTPLLIVTCDRPWELQSAGANQTIKQNDIFKDFIYLKIEIGPFDQILGLHSLFSNLASLIYSAIKTSQPVHLNISFRKPFYDAGFDPEKDLQPEDRSVFLSWFDRECPYVERGLADKNLHFAEPLKKSQAKNDKTLFVFGPSRDLNHIDFIGRVASDRNIPVLADIHSNLRQSDCKVVQSYFNLYLKEIEDRDLPEKVFIFGDRIISDELQKFLNRVDCSITQVGVGTLRQDAIENEFIKISRKLDWEYFVDEELPTLTCNKDEFSNKYISLNDKYSLVVQGIVDEEDRTERSLICNILSEAPQGASVFLAISLIFREADTFCSQLPATSMIYANRGATGIDGIISSSIGTSINSEAPLICIIGDQATLHDLTGLSLVNRRNGPTLILIVNNNGGAIFNIMKKAELLDTLIHSHGYEFEHFAKGFGLDYKKTESVKEAVGIMKTLFNSNQKLVLEVVVDGVESANGLRL